MGNECAAVSCPSQRLVRCSSKPSLGIFSLAMWVKVSANSATAVSYVGHVRVFPKRIVAHRSWYKFLGCKSTSQYPQIPEKYGREFGAGETMGNLQLQCNATPKLRHTLNLNVFRYFHTIIKTPSCFHPVRDGSFRRERDGDRHVQKWLRWQYQSLYFRCERRLCLQHASSASASVPASAPASAPAPASVPAAASLGFDIGGASSATSS